MTLRQVYEGVLIEIDKVQAPSMLLEDFNYLCNKAIHQYVNKRYNLYDVNQQTTDDIRVLKTTATLTATKSNIYGIEQSNDSPYSGIYEVNLPSDYLHVLNCICDFEVEKNFQCHTEHAHI